MKKTILLLTGMICLCGVFSGCSSSNNSRRTNDEQAKEGGSIYVYNEESQIPEIALSVSLKNISPTGATLVFDQYDADAPKGKLVYGAEFVVEVLKNGEWKRAPITKEGNHAFILIGYILPCEEITELEIDWGWLHGELEPGEYRIGKGVDDSVETGVSDSYMVYAHFIID